MAAFSLCCVAVFCPGGPTIKAALSLVFGPCSAAVPPLRAPSRGGSHRSHLPPLLPGGQVFPAALQRTPGFSSTLCEAEGCALGQPIPGWEGVWEASGRCRWRFSPPTVREFVPEEARRPAKVAEAGCLVYGEKRQQLLALCWGLAYAYPAFLQQPHRGKLASASEDVRTDMAAEVETQLSATTGTWLSATSEKQRSTPLGDQEGSCRPQPLEAARLLWGVKEKYPFKEDLPGEVDHHRGRWSTVTRTMTASPKTQMAAGAGRDGGLCPGAEGLAGP
ncbi:uncharacterized protein ACIBXB_014845 [Morphnus guianensis]